MRVAALTLALPLALLAPPGFGATPPTPPAASVAPQGETSVPPRWFVAVEVGAGVARPGVLVELRQAVDDPERIRQVTREVLSRPEYQWQRPTIIQIALEWVGRQIARLLNLLLSFGGAGFAGWVITSAVVLFLGLLAVGFLRRLSPSYGAGEPTTATTVVGADEWRAAAERHEAAGDWKEAVRCRYRALVLELVERGLIDELPGRTAGEYEHQVRGALPAAAEPFSDATTVFQWVWYGTAPSTPEDVRRLRELSERVLAATT